MGSTGTPVNPNPVGQGPGWTVNLTPGLRALTQRSPGVMLGAHEAGTRKYDPSFGVPEGVKDHGAVNDAPYTDPAVPALPEMILMSGTPAATVITSGARGSLPPTPPSPALPPPPA